MTEKASWEEQNAVQKGLSGSTLNIPIVIKGTLCADHLALLSEDERSKITDVVILNGITQLGEGVFSKMKNLKRVQLPNGLQFIDENAFGGCESLEEITIPSTVNKCRPHGTSPFAGCKNLNLTFSSGAYMPLNWFLRDCTVKGLSIPQSMANELSNGRGSAQYEGDEHWNCKNLVLQDDFKKKI